ncbi:radical SAM family heme chaperone HemW [uncultured Selenomonas sp.]|uniref:radical SAM family heme chaperone HemW n=1 Tax=uncultured Selenomonas sp. TaxID=159275 RepID=UPI0028D1F74F|nr:radical SAM family heme chaperone HemW [uncultured Selenomonas sp.]
MGDFGVYVHIPFCRRKCFYCDFPSYAGEERWMSRYREALCREIAAQGCRCLQEGAVRTVYIGGGTPTALLADDLLAVICAVRESFHLTGAEEFTVEVNPGTVDVQLLERLREAGVNRLSFGVQSFSDALLSAIGRIHTAREAEDAVRMAQKADFRVSLDLMYGLPGQTLADLKDSVARAAALGIGHISAYGLAVEDGTPFARMEEAGQLHLPTDDECGDMYDYITAELPRLGYRRYEISNYAKAGEESRHNLAYWQDVPYIGLGAAAHSYWHGRRMENEQDLRRYIACIEGGLSPAREEEPCSRENHIEEFAFLALRTADGLAKGRFRSTFGCDVHEVYGEVIARLQAAGLVEETVESIRLTAQGMKFGNRVFEAFLLERDETYGEE